MIDATKPFSENEKPIDIEDLHEMKFIDIYS